MIGGHQARPTRKLSRAALCFRAAHTAIAVKQLLAIAKVELILLVVRDLPYGR